LSRVVSNMTKLCDPKLFSYRFINLPTNVDSVAIISVAIHIMMQAICQQ